MVRVPTLVPCVRSLQDTFRWIEHYFSVISKDAPTAIDEISRNIESLSISTSFSGVGGIENTMDCLYHGCCAFARRPPNRRPRNVYACELLDESRFELRMPDHPPAHLFSDITDFIAPEFRRELRNESPRMTHRDLERLFTNKDALRKGLILRKAHCEIHGKFCERGVATLHAGGTPCVAWSTMGSRLGTSGPTALCFYTWIGMRLIDQELLCIHENTKEFNEEILERYLGEYYAVFCVPLNSTDFGAICERPRKYTMLVHKKTLRYRMPKSLVWGREWLQQFHRVLDEGVTWRVFFGICSDEEIMDELEWAASRSTVDETLCANLHPRSSFQQVFINQESNFLQGYLDLGVSRGVLSLMQDPTGQPCYSVGKTLGCMIANNWPQYSVEHDRWLVARETLLTNTIVAYSFLSTLGEGSSFLKSREAYGFPPRLRHHMFHQAGDGMSAPSAGSALLWAVSQFDFSTPSETFMSPSLCNLGRMLVLRDSDEHPEDKRPRHSR